MHNENDTDSEIIKSKSQLKREMLALQSLGEELVKLSKEQFEKISLPEDIHDAIVAARNIHQRGAHKRQLQYIGKLMRNLEPGPIQEQLDTIKGQSVQAAHMLHVMENWRDRLINDGDQALEELVEQFPQIDRQHIRQMLRNIHKEKSANKTPKSSRALFRYLRDIITEE